MATLRVLAILPEPVDAAWSPLAAAAWISLEQSLAPPHGSPGIELVRLTPATANAMSARVEHESFDVVHVVGRGSSRPAARHGTITLESSERRARDLNAQNFARWCAGIADLRLVVVQPLGAPSELDVLCDLIVQQAAPVVLIRAANGAQGTHDSVRIVRALYQSLAAGGGVDEAFAEAESQLRGFARAPNDLPPVVASLLAQKQPNQRPRAADAPRPIRAVNPSTTRRLDVPSPPIVTPNERNEEDERALLAKQQIERKRAASAFDVFLCHNGCDKPAVTEIALRLMARGILPWLDQWELRPGMPWQRLLESQISRIQAAAVFVGREGIGPWQRHELDGFLREFNTRGCPVIPVMLPGSGGEPELPLFLRGMTWVDFRVKTPDPLSRLLWGITGDRGF